MKDARDFLDNVRNKIPPNAKIMVVWMEKDSPVVHASQANVNVSDIGNIVLALKMSTLPSVG
ncbi:hypothetical protein UFOVP275_37 [uncultured Caudovirales phage]|uniref:Uncharacterized protein n=1 Tax=uncultured Caudovirales phage TaxID=2100421 RepID=A0A6J5LPB4_9CAUD|nr:hypothetical protein UFOVP275_37 [uncultured Caudovirales phage]